MTRVAGYLNKIFDLLNEEFFESSLVRPTITIQSTPKAYGHFSLRDDSLIKPPIALLNRIIPSCFGFFIHSFGNNSFIAYTFSILLYH